MGEEGKEEFFSEESFAEREYIGISLFGYSFAIYLIDILMSHQGLPPALR